MEVFITTGGRLITMPQYLSGHCNPHSYLDTKDGKVSALPTFKNVSSKSLKPAEADSIRPRICPSLLRLLGVRELDICPGLPAQRSPERTSDIQWEILYPTKLL